MPTTNAVTIGNADRKYLNRNRKKFGAVLTFKDGVTARDITEAMTSLESILEWKTIQRFDPEYGGPVWYIP